MRFEMILSVEEVARWASNPTREFVEGVEKACKLAQEFSGFVKITDGEREIALVSPPGEDGQGPMVLIHGIEMADGRFIKPPARDSKGQFAPRKVKSRATGWDRRKI